MAVEMVSEIWGGGVIEGVVDDEKLVLNLVLDREPVKGDVEMKGWCPWDVADVAFKGEGGVYYGANFTHWGGDEDIMTTDEIGENFSSVC